MFLEQFGNRLTRRIFTTISTFGGVVSANHMRTKVTDVVLPAPKTPAKERLVRPVLGIPAA